MAAKVMPGAARPGDAQRINSLPGGLNDVPVAMSICPASTHDVMHHHTAAMSGATAAPAQPQGFPALMPQPQSSQSRIGAAMSGQQLQAMLRTGTAAPAPAPAAPAPVAAAPAPIATVTPGGKMTQADCTALDEAHSAAAAAEMEKTRTSVPFRWGLRVPVSSLAPGGTGASYTLALSQLPSLASNSDAKIVVNRIHASIISSTHTGQCGLTFPELSGAIPLTWDDGKTTAAFHVPVPSLIQGSSKDVTVYERTTPVDSYALYHYGNTSKEKLESEINIDTLTGAHRIPYSGTLAGMLARKNRPALAHAEEVKNTDGKVTHMKFDNGEILESAIASICAKVGEHKVAASIMPANHIAVRLVPIDTDISDALQKVGLDIRTEYAHVMIQGHMDVYDLSKK